jgi:hypothetical protein
MEPIKQKKGKGSNFTLPQIPGDRALILFTRHTTWETMRSDYDAEAYAEEIEVTQGAGEGSEIWFAAQFPFLSDPLPSWAADFFCASCRLHDLARLRSYPKAHNYRSLNNLAILLAVNRNYFFSASSLRCSFSDRSVIAFGLDRESVEYFIYLDAPIPLLANLHAMDVFVEEIAYFDKESARADLQELMRITPILWVAHSQGRRPAVPKIL